jgi:hypothetical protein
MRQIAAIIGILLATAVVAIPLLAIAMFASVVGNGSPLFVVLFFTAIASGFVCIMSLFFKTNPNTNGRDASSPESILRSSDGAISRNIGLYGEKIETNRAVSTSIETNGEPPLAALTASQPILEPSDIQKFVATASASQIRIAHADQVSVTKFFNAIRYGQTELIRKTVSASPLLVLAHDAYGNTPLAVAKQEGNHELIIFFSACLTKV